jgi:hypothetical protein
LAPPGPLLWNWLIRYQPVTSYLQVHPGRRPVLEVGSGAVGLACLYPHTFIGCDLDFGHPPHPLMQPVVGSATRLPFPDRSFPIVVCLDVLEHIPPSQRPAFLRELLRVARSRVILAFPSGDAAKSADRRLVSFYRLCRLPEPNWLEEHQKWPLPSAEELEMQLGHLSLPYLRMGSSVWPLHLLVMILDSTPLGPRLAQLATRHPRLLLPLLQWLDRRSILANTRHFYRLVYYIDKEGSR